MKPAALLCRLLAIAALISLFNFCAAAQTPEKPKIGVSVGLTGNLAAIGTGIRNAILLADRERDPDDKVDFLIEDDGFDPKRTVVNVAKFISQDKVKGLIIFGSGTALSVNNIAEHSKIPLIALGNSKKIIAGKNYSMMHFLNTDRENEVIAEEAKRRPFKRIAVICTSHDAMLDLAHAFTQSFPERIVLSEELLPGETDFRSIISKINAANSDAVYNVLLPGAAGLFARQLRAQGFHGELFSAHAVDDWNEVALSQGALIGTWFVTGNVIVDETFADRYKAAFNDEPRVATPNGYDAAALFINAVKTPDANEYLHHVDDFQGVMGRYKLNPAGYFELPAALRSITDSGFVPLRGN